MSLRADIKALYTEGYKANFETVKQLKPKRFGSALCYVLN